MIKVFTRDVLGHTLRFSIEKVGMDYNMIISGGAKAHIGSVSMATPVQNLETGLDSATVSTFVYLGHKDDHIGHKVAYDMCKKLRANVVVCCGVHFDAISKEEIELVLTASESLIQEALMSLTE